MWGLQSRGVLGTDYWDGYLGYPPSPCPINNPHSWTWTHSVEPITCQQLRMESSVRLNSLMLQQVPNILVLGSEVCVIPCCSRTSPFICDMRVRRAAAEVPEDSTVGMKLGWVGRQGEPSLIGQSRGGSGSLGAVPARGRSNRYPPHPPRMWCVCAINALKMKSSSERILYIVQ